MEPDSSRVIVTTGTTPDAFRVHHRDFPEICAEGRTSREAAAHLVNRLVLALDTALTNWRRETLGRAVADVQAYLDQPEQ